jgi:hypothetical protein
VAAGNGKGGNDRGNGRVFYTIVTANTLLRFSSDKPHKLRAKQITGLPVGVSIKRIDFRPASGDLYAARQQQGRVPAGPEDGHAVPEGPTFDRVPSILNGDNTGFDTPLRTLVFVQICANCGEESVSAGSTGPSSRRTWHRARHGRRSRSPSRTSRAAARRAASQAAPPNWGGPGNHLRRRRGGRHRAGARLRRHETVLGGRRAVGPAASGSLANATGDAVPYLVMVAICLATLVAAPSRAAPAAA